MNYFKENCERLVVREAARPNEGLRIGQVGALHAIAAHFIERSEPAIVSLPTGYGKTAVMAATCFIAKCRRVLIVVPTAALRSQTAKAFRSLETIRRLHLIPQQNELADPAVSSIEERMTSITSWEQLSDADVVVATPHSASPEIEGVVAPPEDFFDLVLVDEGHHTPARTWSSFIRQTPEARHVLFSATPFRKDRLQLPGRVAFHYSMRRAVEERAFGRVVFRPVTPAAGGSRQERDAALIENAVQLFERDRQAGYQHRLLIRTDTVSDAERLAPLYIQAGVRVEAISSRLSRGTVARIEERLQDGDLDGVVCVDMFGEGYDFPKFKIAVLHATHRSLVPTLQFIGRFARTNDEQTGDASFLAVPSDINAESDELYRETADWDLLLADVAEARQELTLREREVLRSFEETAGPSADYEAVNSSQFRLPQHIAAYRARIVPNFQTLPVALGPLQVTNSWCNNESSAYLLLTKETKAPVWSRGDSLTDSRHDCFLFKYYAETGIVFITATQRTERYYSELIEHFLGGNATQLPFESVRKVLNGLQSQEFFSIGLRNTSPNATTETYRIVAGSQADRGVRDTDGAFFCQGHFMGRGSSQGESEIIGASSSGRVWSVGKLSIPEMLNWMDTLHARISAANVNIGRSGLDKLPFGETLTSLPANTSTCDWSRETYRESPMARWQDPARARRVCLLDLDLKVESIAQGGASLVLSLSDEGNIARLRYRLNNSPRYVSLGGGPELQVETRDGGHTSIEDWLEESPLTFYTSELNSYTASTFNRRAVSGLFELDCIQVENWSDCEIRVEFDTEDPERRTVQRHLRDKLSQMADIDFIVYDHRPGEAADFIVGRYSPGNRCHVTLYHCKGAGGAQPSGERVEDVYELVGQSVKAARYQRHESLLSHLDRRTAPNPAGGHSPFIRGDRDAVLQTLRNIQPIDLQLTIVAVQPGIAGSTIHERLRVLMAAANDSVASQASRLLWMTSA